MATGTIVYNKDQQQIYPISDGTVIISNASGSKSNVEDDLKKLFKQVSDLSGSSEAVNSIIIKIHYLPANTADESEIKLSSKQWSDTFELPTEENPFLGFRAVRFCLQRKEDIYKPQLRALLRASAFGKVRIMVPLVTCVDELRAVKAIIEELKQELDAEGIAYDKDIQVGVMMETAAASLIADILAKEADFFSIGTNDLTQYTLAIDRQNSKLDNIYDAHHPAVLRMIQKTIENGHKAGCWVGICGELGADMTLTETFLKMGIDELSVSPTFVLPIRKLIREMSTK